MLKDGIGGLGDAAPQVCVVGAGPVGLALAADLARRGSSVLLLESGGKDPEPEVQSLSTPEWLDPARHELMTLAVSRQLGGTSNLWGARCLPFDPIDFEPRPFVDARWPIGYADVEPFLAAAVEATRSGDPVYRSPFPPLGGTDGDFRLDALERWSNVPRAQAVHAEAIANDANIELRSHASLVGMEFGENGAVEAVTVAHTTTGDRVRMPTKTLVIAAGGVETARILLAARAKSPDRFGGENGPLGRYYMGHVFGEIADIVLSPEADGAFDFQVDANGSYVRRRIVPDAETQRRHKILNSAFWPVVPQIADPRHGSGILSMIYLALSVGPVGRLLLAEAILKRHIPKERADTRMHLANVLTGAPAAVAFSANFLIRRYMRRTRLPGLFVRNRARRYGLFYHSEQVPKPDSRVTLGSQTDRLGVPRVVIDYRYHEEDVASVVRTHDLLDQWLEKTGLGRIDYRMPRKERSEAVLAQSRDGMHQIGLARMAASRTEGVVDADLRAFDAPNLYLVGSAVLPTAGQANPTLTAMALALRLAERLAR